MLQKTSCGLDGKRGTGDDQRVRIGDLPKGADADIFREGLAVEYHGRLDDAAALTARDAGGMKDILSGKGSVALHTVVFMNGAVDLVDADVAGLFVQAVDVLGDNAPQLIRFFQLEKAAVRSVRLRVRIQHKLTVKIKENIRMEIEKRFAEDHFRGKGTKLPRIQAARGMEIRDPTGGGHAGAAKENDAPGAADDLLKLIRHNKALSF